MSFFAFPAEHWKHIRATNPIENIFSTVRNRTRKTGGCPGRRTALVMVHGLIVSARRKWRRISGPNRLPEIIEGIEFRDGIKQIQAAAPSLAVGTAGGYSKVLMEISRQCLLKERDITGRPEPEGHSRTRGLTR